jgi:CRP-like cAMP-binding protein
MADLIQSKNKIYPRSDSMKPDNYLTIDITKTTEQNIERIINKDMANNSRHITKTKIIYELLFKLNNFKEFLTFYNIEEQLIFEILSTGILKSYKKNEQIFKKYSYPEFYFLVLIGGVLQPNMPYEFTPGKFFGEKNLLNNSKYRIIPYANSDNTILLLIPKEFFVLKLRYKVISGTDKIRQMIFNSFKIFTMIERKTYERYYNKMQKLFPSFGEVIVSNKDIANAIYLIYNGSCILNNEKEGDLFILQEGDIFGDECLTNFNERGKLLKNTYKYNIINKSESTIIFKFIITDLTKYILNGMKTYLTSYFLKREDIIKKHFAKKKLIQNCFKKEYNIFKKVNKQEALLNNDIITNEKIEKSFNNVLSEIRLNKINSYYIKRFIPNMSKILNKKINKKTLIQDYLQKEKLKTPFQSQEKIFSINTINSNLNANSNLSPKRENRKLMSFSERRKNNKKGLKNISFYPNQISINSSTKMLTISDNNANANIYLTSINHNFNSLNNDSTKHKDKLLKTPITDIKKRVNTEASFNSKKLGKRLINSAFVSNRFYTSCKNNSKKLSVRDQIENYGIEVLNTLSYFNNGKSEKFIKRKFSANNPNENKENLYFRTQKYNIPLYVLCDSKEKKKFPKLANF